MKKILKDNEFQRSKINIFESKIEELEQHVGILANAQENEDYDGEPNVTSNVGENSNGEIDQNLLDEIKREKEYTAEQAGLVPLQENPDEVVQGTSSMERLMNKPEGEIGHGKDSAIHKNSIATLNNDL